jgi:nucleoside phosphorylase
MSEETSMQTPTYDRPELSEMLSNGESPRVGPRSSFVLPPVENANASILARGTQVLLLAATQTEREAVLERMHPLIEQAYVLRVFSGAQTYYVGRIGSVDVVLTTCRAGSQTRDGSGLVTYEAISRVSPRAVVAVGMAFGGYTDKLKIGDVLVSTHVIPYEPSRIQSSGNIPRGGEHDAGTLLLNRFLEARGWTFQRDDGYACQVRDGRILSGEKLVDSLEFKSELFATYPEAIGGEMEASGVYAASERWHISEWIIVKAVCDWGDGTKHKAHQPLAATAAIALVEHVFTPNGVLDDLPPFKGTADVLAVNRQPSNVVNNVENQIGTQNIVYGNQTIVMAPLAEIDALLDTIKTLINKWHLDEARVRLDEADARMWSRMSSTQKARLRALRALRKAVLGDVSGAARDFFEAHDLAPTDEKAVVRKCQALLLQQQKAEAYTEARAALTSFPSHPYIRPLLIASAPADVAIDDLLPMNWQHLHIASEEAVAASQRVRGSDSELAERILRRVHEPDKDDAEYWSALASVLAQRIHEDEHRGQGIGADRREDLVAALRVAHASIRAPASEKQRGHIALALAVNSKKLGRIDDYHRWFAVAKELIPDEIHLLCERAHEAGDQGDFRKASELLRAVISSPQRPDLARVAFAHALLKLATPEAREEACAVLEQAASDAAEPTHDRRRAAVKLVEAQMDFDPIAAATSIERHRETLGTFRAERLGLVLAHESGAEDKVIAIASHMLADQARYSHDELLDLGALFGELRLNDQCVGILELLAPRTELTRATICLINAAIAIGRLELAANICQALRTAGVEDPRIVDGEACILSIRGDLTGALELIQVWLAKHPDDKWIRFRLSQIAAELGRKDLLSTRADQLPEPTDAHPEIAPDVVRILRAANEHGEARRFAYANLKRRRRDEWAWKAMAIAGMPAAALGAGDDEDDVARNVPHPVFVAGPGMAVHIKEKDSLRWIQLEERDELATAEDEYGPTHPMTIALTGKKVGDCIELQRAQFGFPARIAEIEAIVSCFTHSCQQCNNAYELQFPNSHFIYSFHVPDSVDELIEILLSSAKKRHESIEKILKAYESNPQIPLHGLAELICRPVFEMIPFLVSSNSVIHATRPPGRMKPAQEMLMRTREIVIETTAISTLAMLEVLDRARQHFAKLWIARATLDRLRAYIHRTISSGSSGYMGLEGGQLFFSRRDPNFEQRRADCLSRLLAAVELWDVFQESDRDLLASTAWDNWAKVAGGGTAESVHLAKRRKLALWTDDVVVAAAAEHEGAAAISTQAVFETLAALDIVTRDEAAEVGAQLVGWRYVSTRTPPELFLAAAKVAKWDPSACPLVQHLELLTTADWPDRDLALIVAEVFRLWWSSNTLDRKAIDALVVAALIRIAARTRAEEVMRMLLVAVQRRFGLDVIGARHVSEVIVGWFVTQPH